MLTPIPRRLATGGLAATLAIASAALSPAAHAVPSAGAVIAEVYGGGGNSGATLTHDFIELGNRGAAAASLAGWSVQYLPAVPSTSSQWQVTPLTGAVAAAGRYLVQEGAGAGGTTPLPTPDATGSIAMSGSAGTVALVNTTTALTCKTAADCAADARIVDLVGYGTSAVVREGTPTATLSSTTSAARTGSPLVDTDVNSADFTVGAPTPTNTGGGGDPEPPDPTPGPHRIRDVQGNTRLSPLVGQTVTNVPGIVTAVRAFGSRGFWLSDPAPDADPATSEGLFVFTGTTPTVAVGDSVVASGRVTEFYPLGSGETVGSTSNQSITELAGGATYLKVSSGNPVPAAEELTPATVPLAYAPDAGGSSIESLVLQPQTYALDFYESREGMPLRVTDARVVGPTDGFNALWVTSKPDQNRSARGATVYTSYDDPNSGRLKIESLIPFAQRPFPVANVGDVLAGVTEGPLDYSRFGGYVLQASTLGAHVSGGLQPQIATRNSADRVSIASYNVENLAFTNPQAKFDRLAMGIVLNLGNPDIVALEEIQDNNGATNDGTVAADQTLQRFVDAIVLAGGPRYQWRQIDPVDGEDGGQPGGNIRVGFLFNPARVGFVDRPGGDATTAVGVTGSGGNTALTVSPGRIDPTNPAWESSRKPLVGEFTFGSKTVFVIANHFASKGGDQALHGRFQPPNRTSEIQRRQQAILVHDFWHQLSAANRQAQVVILGDINDFQFSPVTDLLVGSDGEIRSMFDLLPETERYSYVFDGNAQVLDQILVSRGVRNPDFDVVHINAEFANQASDHDPSVVRFTPR